MLEKCTCGKFNINIQYRSGVMRFVKSQYAAGVAAKKGFEVSPITKTVSWESCRSHDIDVVNTNGFCVKATKTQLKKIGLLSSSCKSQIIIW